MNLGQQVVRVEILAWDKESFIFLFLLALYPVPIPDWTRVSVSLILGRYMYVIVIISLCDLCKKVLFQCYAGLVY